ncbi:MAG: lysylphosphatidylglycerol synthase domain-containing protein [Nitrospirota bacterium]|nr:lysylphosphatidylglycerol synthase domain-containing protein [Nitrospirota bacterium]
MYNKRWKVWIRSIAKTLLVAGLLVFLAKALITNWNRIAGYTWDISPVPLAISFIFLILFYLASFLLWENLCRGIGVEFSTGMNLSIWFFSQVGKYVPGKIWGPVGRVYLAEQQGVRKIDMGICLAYEAVLTTLGGAILALATIPFWAGAIGPYPITWLLIGVPGVLILIHPKIMGWSVNRALRMFKFQSVSIPFSQIFLLRILLISLLLWVFGGVGFFFLVKAVFPVDGSMVLTYMGIFAASCMLGILAFLTPAGIGVREGAFILLLQPLMPSEVAIVITFGARLWMTCVEIIGIGLGGGIVAWYGKGLRSRTESTP